MSTKKAPERPRTGGSFTRETTGDLTRQAFTKEAGPKQAKAKAAAAPSVKAKGESTTDKGAAK